MSVDLFVFIHDENLPSRDEWQRAIESADIDLVLDEFEAREHTGFLPAQLRGESTGFEYYCGSVQEMFGEQPPEIGDRDCVVSFVLHGDTTELNAAMLAAAVLTKHAGGVFYDPQGDEFAEGDGVFDIIRHEEAAELERREYQAAKDADLTDRRCPQCGNPCPAYRKTCKVCGFQIGRGNVT